jgi:3-oxoacid CoA-transferase subunit A/3-oxoadipate CoA-transferase alpha subunit
MLDISARNAEPEAMSATTYGGTASPPRSKVRDAAEAVAAVRPGAVLMVGGFGLVGAPLTLVEALGAHPGARDLTVISNNLGEPGRGLGRLLLDGRVRKAVGSYFTSNPDVVRAHLDGSLEVELVPQGTLAESIRAGGAGIGGFFTKTGLGTPLTEGCEERVIRGERYVLQESRRADVALIRARTADELGNLVYAKTARNFNPDMATAADLVIAEVDEVVPVGTLDPEAVVTPHLFVDVLVLSEGVRA